MRVNVHIYPTPFRNESRILKITQTLRQAGLFDRILIMATWEEGLPASEDLDETRRVVRIPRNLGRGAGGSFWKAVRTAEWSWRLLRFLGKGPLHCLNCHTLSVLPLCVTLKVLTGAKLIYDTHELETETAGSKGIRRVLARVVEGRLIPFADATIAVNESIAAWYRKAYGLKQVWVVKNVPYRQEAPPVLTGLLREACGIAPDDLLFLYQGAIEGDRGIERLLKVFRQLRQDKHIVFMGFGSGVETVRDHARQHPNIHYHPAVPPSDVFRYTAGADVGVHLIENTCLNHYYCLPNKIWEYLNAALPVIVSDLPEMRQVVDRYQCGWTCGPSEDEAVRLVGGITRDDVREKRLKVQKAREGFGWHLEEAVLLEVYEGLRFRRVEKEGAAATGRSGGC